MRGNCDLFIEFNQDVVPPAKARMLKKNRIGLIGISSTSLPISRTQRLGGRASDKSGASARANPVPSSSPNVTIGMPGERRFMSAVRTISRR